MLERNAIRYYILPFCLIRLVKYYDFVTTFPIYNNLTFVCIKWPKRSLNQSQTDTFTNNNKIHIYKHTYYV